MPGLIQVRAGGVDYVRAAGVQSLAVTGSVPSVSAVSSLLEVDPSNPRYLRSAGTGPLLLVGAHTWCTVNDTGTTNPPPAFPFTTWLSDVLANGHNCVRHFVNEQASWDVSEGFPWYIAPTLYVRTGPGTALDGLAKFDLTQLNADYFTRLRERVVACATAGLWSSVQLFSGWCIKDKTGGGNNPWNGHPFNAANNIQGFEGGDGGGDGSRWHTLYSGVVITYQTTYVKQVIDTLNNIDRVVFEICNESDGDDSFSGYTTNAWENYWINYIHSYEATLAKQHVVLRSISYPAGSWANCLASNAELAAPATETLSDGTKVVVSDTDHIYGIVSVSESVPWVWRSFCLGSGILWFMDPYSDYKPEWAGFDSSTYEPCRDNLRYALVLAQRLPLALMTPQGALASTGYCLANNAATGGDWVVWVPNATSCTLDVSATSRTLTLEWLNTATGAWTSGGTVSGGATRTLTATGSGNWVAYVYDGA